MGCNHPDRNAVSPGDPPAPADVLRSELADDPDMVDLVEAFVAELPDRIAALEHALAERDLETLSRLAHQLKGVGGGYGFPDITDSAAILEQSAKAGGDLDRLARETRGLILLCQRAHAAHATARGT